MDVFRIPVRHPDGHPGGDLRHHLETYELNQQEIADALGVSRFSLNQVVNERRAVTPEMALRFERVFGIDAQDIVERQARHDLAALRARPPAGIKGLKPIA